MKTIKDVMQTRVENLEFSVRSTNCMRNAGIVTLEDLTKADLFKKKPRNCGKKSLEEISNKLATFDLSFNMNERDWLNWGLEHLTLIKNLNW